MSNLTSDELHHAGRKGMKWGMHIFGRRQLKGEVRGKRGAKPEQQNVKIPKKPRRSVDERLREAEFRDAYRTRDNMSTKALKSKIARLEAEQRFKQLVEAPEKARLEALQKKKQARLAFIGKVGSAALDVYSKAPSSIAGRNLSGQAAKDAIEAFKKRQEWAKAFKDVPTTMTKFTQSINVGGVDVYIPETIQNRFMIQHAGRKGMKWGMNIFGKRDRYARNNFSKEHYQTYKYVRERVKKGKSEYKLSKKIHRLTKDLYDSQPTEQNRLLTNMAYDARKDAKATRKKYKGSVKKIFNKYSETDFDLKGGLTQSGVNMGEIINGVYIPSQDDLLLHYGKKGMKWKKGRQGMTPAQAAMADAEEREANRDYDKEAEKYKKDAAYYQSKIKSGVEKGKARNKKEQKYLDKHEEAMRNYIGALDRKEKQKQKKTTKKVKHSGVSDDTLMHYGKKGMKWKKGRQGMTPAQAAMADAEEREANRDYDKEAEKYKKDAAYYQSKIKSGVEKGKARNKKEQKYLDKHEEAMRNYIGALDRKEKQKQKKTTKKVKHSGVSDDLLLHYGKKGMKWKKHLTNGVNSALEGIENAVNWVDDQTFDRDRESGLKDRSESNKRRINDPKYGRTYNTASDPFDGKKNVDVKRALREDRDNVVPSRTREGMRQENKFIEKIRKRIKLPRLKQSISSEDTLLHYGKKGYEVEEERWRFRPNDSC